MLITHRRKLAKVSKLIFLFLKEMRKSLKLEYLTAEHFIINGTRVKNEFGAVSSCRLYGFFYGYILAYA
jgi:hypothetical protein